MVDIPNLFGGGRGGGGAGSGQGRRSTSRRRRRGGKRVRRDTKSDPLAPGTPLGEIARLIGGGGGKQVGMLDKSQAIRDAYARQLAAMGGPPDFAAMFDVNLPGPVLAPAPNRDTYVAPYNAATLVAHDAYNKAQPVIGNIYDDLGAALESREGQARREGTKTRKAAAQEQAALRAQSTALTAPTSLGESMGGTPEAAAQGEADRAFMALQQADQTQMARDVEAASVADSEARQQDAEGMRSGALANSRNNLEAILGQIGIGRSEAERQFASDSQQVSLANAQAKQEHAMLKQQMKSESLQAAQQAEQLWAERNERAAQAALTSGRQMWETKAEQRSQRYPNGTAAMLDIISAAGEGATGRAQAYRILQELWPSGEPDRLTDPETGQKLYGGKRLNPNIIRQWIDEYYDEQEMVDPQAFTAAGGDPTYLAVRQLYAGS